MGPPWNVEVHWRAVTQAHGPTTLLEQDGAHDVVRERVERAPLLRARTAALAARIELRAFATAAFASVDVARAPQRRDGGVGVARRVGGAGSDLTARGRRRDALICWDARLFCDRSGFCRRRLGRWRLLLATGERSQGDEPEGE